MKKRFILTATFILMCNTTTAFAFEGLASANYNYTFETTVDYSTVLGKPTTTDIIARNEQTENVRRNKDVAYLPPSYGVFSAQIDTDRSNPYIMPDSSAYIRSASVETYPLGVDLSNATETGVLPSTSLMQDSVSTNSTKETLTEVKYYADGSIGRLKIPEIDIDIKVYEGETDENMKRGGAHFEFTSGWDGVIGIAGHNNGTYGYFRNLKKLEKGDRITYETKYGTRRYKVTSIDQISDTDYSIFRHSGDNQIVLITCVAGVPSQRLAVIATEY